MLKIKILFTIFLFATIVSNTSAGRNQSQDIGTQMVTAGIESFVYSIGDSMFGMASNSNSIATNSSSTPSAIFQMLTYSVDPYSYPWVQHWWNVMLVAYVFIFTMVCLGGGSLLLINSFSPETTTRIAWLIGEDSRLFDLKGFVRRQVSGLFFPFFVLFGVWLLLKLNYVFSGMMASTALNAVPPTVDNLFAYLFMGFGYVVLAILFALRNVIIVLFAAGSLGVAALYLIPEVQGVVRGILVYFVIVVFMQPAMIFTAAIGVVFIKNMPPEINMFVPATYMALLVILIYLGIICLFGRSIIDRILGVALVRRL